MDRAPLSWTTERADTLFRQRVREEGSGIKARSSRAERAIKHCASSCQKSCASSCQKLRERLSKELRDVFVVQLGDKGTQLGPEF
jgi:hypothetical protein